MKKSVNPTNWQKWRNCTEEVKKDSQRKDQEQFYYKRVFVNFEDFKEKLRHWVREYNNFPMKPLGWKSPNEKLAEALAM